MTQEQYKTVLRAQKEQAKPAKKLIHLIINYRSHMYARYPHRFTEIIRQVKRGSKLFDGDGLWYFYQLEGDNWRQPNFTPMRRNVSCGMETESELPF